MSSGRSAGSSGTIDRLLDRIPGYGGYRDKERRRDSDRAIRDNLALEYGQLADRLGVSPVASPTSEQFWPLASSTSLISSFRHSSTASGPRRMAMHRYSRMPRSMQRHLTNSRSSIGPRRPAGVARRADRSTRIGRSEIPRIQAAGIRHSGTIQGLDDRFDKRNAVLTSGQASTEPDVLDMLDPPRTSVTPSRTASTKAKRCRTKRQLHCCRPRVGGSPQRSYGRSSSAVEPPKPGYWRQPIRRSPFIGRSA